MRNLRTIRIFVTTVMMAAAIGFMALQPTINPVLQLSDYSQIVPSRIAWARGISSITFGATLFWLIASFFFGRVYCSSVCPIGTLQDMVIAFRKRTPLKRKPFRFKKSSRWRWHSLIIYAVCLVFGIGIVTLLLEPWQMFRAMAAVARPFDLSAVWEELGWGMLGGILAGVISLLAVIAYSFFCGRDFCNTVCPIGTVLGALSEKSVYQIRIDPDKCINCLKCEEVCKASCIKITQRYVDNTRCIRCFDCIDICPNEAVRYDSSRSRAATPLMTKSN